jgi:hypothetical protein
MLLRLSFITNILTVLGFLFAGSHALQAQALPGSPKPYRVVFQANNEWQGPLVNNRRLTHTYDAQQRLSQSVKEVWSESNQQFAVSERTEYDYADDGRLREIRNGYWNATSAVWQNTSRERYYYHSGLLDSLWTLEYFNGQSWSIAQRRRTSYTTDLQILSQREENRSGNAWIVRTEILNTYNTQGKSIENLRHFNSETGVPQTSYRYRYEYDTAGRLESEEYEAIVYSISNDWAKQHRDEYFYTDADQRVDERRRFGWFDLQQQWGLVSVIAYTYTPTETIELGDATASHPSYRRSTRYNAVGQLTAMTFENWNNALGSLKPINESTWAYRPDGALLEFRSFYAEINAPNLLLYPGTAELYEYDATTAVRENWKDWEAVVFPNPATDAVSVTSRGAAIQQIVLLDAAGKALRTIPVAAPIAHIERGTLPAGIYTLLLHSEAGVTARRVVWR